MPDTLPYRVRVNGEFWGVFYATSEGDACDQARAKMASLPRHLQRHVQIISARLAAD